MMNKLKSARLNLVKFLFVLPFVAVLLLAFRAQKNLTPSNGNFWLTGIVIDANSERPLKGVEIREEISGRIIVTDENGYFKMNIRVKDPSAKLSASFSLAGYEKSTRRLNPTNSGIEFVYLHRPGKKGPKGTTWAYPGDPQYSDVVEKFGEYQKQKKTDELLGKSTHPIWIIDGVPYALFNDGKGGKGSAWFDKNTLKESPEFRVFVDGKVMTMEEANNTISRFNLDGVDAISRSEALSIYGVNYNLLILKTNQARTVHPVTDTVPPKVVNGDKLKSISTEFEINDKEAVLKLKDGTVEKYDLTDAKQKEAFEKKYGKIISIKGNQNINSNINTNTDIRANTNVTGTIATTISIDGEIVVTPVTVTGIGLGTGNGSGKGIGVGTATTVAPVTIVSGTGLTTTSPVVVEGVPLSKNIVTPVTLASGVGGTTVIAPMNPIATGEGVSVIDEDNVIINGKEEVLVTITNRTTRLQLDEFKKQLKDKGLDLNYADIEYNTKGILTYISGTLDSKNGRSNFVAVDFDKLILSMITDGTRVYFKVRVKEKEVI